MRLETTPWQRLVDLFRRHYPEASRLSDQIDQEITRPGSSGDPVLGAVTRAASPERMPPGLEERSWRGLEIQLFGSPTIAGPVSRAQRFSRPQPRMHHFRAPRLAALALAAALVAVPVALWQTPLVRARSLLHRAHRAWMKVRSYDADLQFLSMVPGKQMEWSGRQVYGSPGRMLLQVALMGIPVRMVVNGSRAQVDVSTATANSETLSRFRFLGRALQPTLVMDALDHARGARYEGEEPVLAQPCQVVSFNLSSEREGAAALSSMLPDATAGRVWLSLEHHLPLQVEFYRRGGALALSYRFSRIAYGIKLRRHLFDLPPTRHLPTTGAQVLHHKLLNLETVGFRLPGR